MFDSVCNFMALAGKETGEKLEDEFQYQMDLTDGEYVFWEAESFDGVQLEPALTAEAQAILQFFSSCACPISMLRLGRSLSERNSEHGPIVSDSLALKHLLKGFEIIDNNLYDEKIKAGMLLIVEGREFRAACELTISYEKELHRKLICPEIKQLITRYIDVRSKHLQ